MELFLIKVRFVDWRPLERPRSAVFKFFRSRSPNQILFPSQKKIAQVRRSDAFDYDLLKSTKNAQKQYLQWIHGKLLKHKNSPTDEKIFHVFKFHSFHIFLRNRLVGTFSDLELNSLNFEYTKI